MCGVRQAHAICHSRQTKSELKLASFSNSLRRQNAGPEDAYRYSSVADPPNRAKSRCDVSSLRRLSFLAAVRQVHGPSINLRLFRSLELLNEDRNIVAHEESTGEIFIKVAEIGRLCKGIGYHDSPASADEANAQFKEVLAFVESWGTIL
jgi:hypothetical protein